GNVTRFSYDPRGRMLTRTDAVGVTTSYTHDLAGNQLSEVVYRTDEFGAQVKVERTQKYDALNRVVMDTDALGHNAVTEYDPLGRVKARVDRRGFRSVTEYDELGQLSAMRYADGTHDSYTYHAEGRRLTTTDPRRACADLGTGRYRNEIPCRGADAAPEKALGEVLVAA
ncbi:MAG: RHS repeat protein, partial [Deltaproteobacteria bacterium]|nr:RHS repeat protein [Deltaproteobacteria bacterium]